MNQLITNLIKQDTFAVQLNFFKWRDISMTCINYEIQSGINTLQSIMKVVTRMEI